MFFSERYFPYTIKLKSHFPTILSELKRIPKSAYSEWPEHHLYKAGWKVFGLIAFGKTVSTSKLCPITTQLLLNNVPRIYTGGFSLLEGGAHIKPHKGNTKRIIRSHLGLIVPDNCQLRVGKQTKTWRTGQWIIFDDTYEHEAFNRSKNDRVVLLVDIKK